MTRDKWERMRASYLIAMWDALAFEIEMSSKYGGDLWGMWATNGERSKLKTLEARQAKIRDAIIDLLVKHSPRGERWMSGVPCYWLAEKLTYDDAMRPTTEALSVEVPLSFGATERDRIK